MSRLEEEKRRQKDKETAKQKKAEAMREVIEAAERLAKEEKKLRRKRDVNENNKPTENLYESNLKDRLPDLDSNSIKNTNSSNLQQIVSVDNETQLGKEVKKMNNQGENNFLKMNETSVERNSFDESKEPNSIRIPVSKDVAIVLSGRLEDAELLNKANLQVVNLVMTPTPRKNEVNHIISGLNALVNNCNSNYITKKVSPRFVENRLLTPSKYRTPNSRDCGTQTDSEKEIQDLQSRIEEMEINNFTKEIKDAANNNQRDVEK